MRKILSSFLAIFLITSSAFAATNPFFWDNDRQVALHLGQGIDSGFLVPPPLRPVPFAIMHFQYSLPTTFFELPARQSLNAAMTVGYGKKYGWNWNDYSIPIAFLSEDVALFHGENWYFGTGIDLGMQAQQNERLGSKMLFQFKLFTGFKINNSLNLEIFMLHMSNGNTALENYSYAFYGLGFVHNF